MIKFKFGDIVKTASAQKLTEKYGHNKGFAETFGNKVAVVTRAYDNETEIIFEDGTRSCWDNELLILKSKETNQSIEAQSFKNDRKDNKPRWELLPIETLEEVVKVYTFGAEKYAENSWQNLENGKERYYAALMRHLVAWRKGETKDEESLLHPLSHVIWNAIALLWLEMNNK